MNLVTIQLQVKTSDNSLPENLEKSSSFFGNSFEDLELASSEVENTGFGLANSSSGWTSNFGHNSSCMAESYSTSKLLYENQNADLNVNLPENLKIPEKYQQFMLNAALNFIHYFPQFNLIHDGTHRDKISYDSIYPVNSEMERYQISKDLKLTPGDAKNFNPVESFFALVALLQDTFKFTTFQAKYDKHFKKIKSCFTFHGSKNFEIGLKFRDWKKIVGSSLSLGSVNSQQGYFPVSRHKNASTANLLIKCTDNIKIPVHREILETRSEYFNLMFNSNFAEAEFDLAENLENLQLEADSSNLPEDHLQTVKFNSNSSTCYNILDFLYSGKTPSPNLDDHDLINILMLADQYLLPSLFYYCEFLLAEKLEISNFVAITEAAYFLDQNDEAADEGSNSETSGHKVKHLLDCCYLFIFANLPEMIERNLLNSLNLEILEHFDDFYSKMLNLKYKLTLEEYLPVEEEEDQNLGQKSSKTGNDFDESEYYSILQAAGIVENSSLNEQKALLKSYGMGGGEDSKEPAAKKSSQKMINLHPVQEEEYEVVAFPSLAEMQKIENQRKESQTLRKRQTSESISTTIESHLPVKTSSKNSNSRLTSKQRKKLNKQNYENKLKAESLRREQQMQQMEKLINREHRNFKTWRTPVVENPSSSGKDAKASKPIVIDGTRKHLAELKNAPKKSVIRETLESSHQIVPKSGSTAGGSGSQWQTPIANQPDSEKNSSKNLLDIFSQEILDIEKQCKLDLEKLCLRKDTKLDTIRVRFM